jgi:hypothetical protein
LPHQAFKITDTVAVGVHERVHIQAVDYRILVPEIIYHFENQKLTLQMAGESHVPKTGICL